MTTIYRLFHLINDTVSVQFNHFYSTEICDNLKRGLVFVLCVSNVFFISIFVPVHIVVLLILLTILNNIVAWSHITYKLLLDLPSILNKLSINNEIMWHNVLITNILVNYREVLGLY